MGKIIVILFSIFIMSVDSYASDFPAKEIYARFAPSVVVIKASDGSGAGMIGSGSIISNDGMVITNAHVVISKDGKKPYSRIIVYVKPENKASVSDDDLSKYFEAEVLHYADELDLAMLKLQGFDVRANIIEFADPAEIDIGEEVVAIGHPEQGGFWSLTYGRISGEMRDYQGITGKDVFQTDTSVNRGNSGGPLLDKRGYMVAVNSNIARIGKGGLPITGVNFSIKSSVVKKWMAENGFTIAYGKTPLPEVEKKVEHVTAGKSDDKTATEEKFSTPARAYDYDSFLKAAEKDIEDMMEDMRGKTRRK